jgi:hypothetical protein
MGTIHIAVQNVCLISHKTPIPEFGHLPTQLPIVAMGRFVVDGI